jgi:hypothetical protein
MPSETPNPEELAAHAAQSITGDPSLRDELTDDEAQPLIDWGLAQVDRLAQQVMLAQHAAARDSNEVMDESVSDLRKLMKRVNRLVGHRAAGEMDRVDRDLQRLARFSERLYGAAVTPPDEARLAAFKTELAGYSNLELIGHLLRMFAPEVDAPAQLDAPDAPEQITAPPTPDQLTAPPAPEQLTAPPRPDQLTAPPTPEKLTPPPITGHLPDTIPFDSTSHSGDESPDEPE